MTLPNFIVAGAPKAGTHSLYEYLREHPQVFMTEIKEPRFFSFNGNRNRLKYPIETIEEYQSLFSGVKDETAIGEASAIYFWTRNTPQRIKETLPDVRLVFSLREPVQRMFSIYHMNLRSRGTNKNLGFIDALATDPMLQRKYHDCLKPYFDLFDRCNIKIILFEDLSKDTALTITSIYKFLGVQPDFVPDLKVHNPGGSPKNKMMHRLFSNKRLKSVGKRLIPENSVKRIISLRDSNLNRDKMVMTEEEYNLGYEFFREDILRTQELIRIDLSHWLRPEASAEGASRQASF